MANYIGESQFAIGVIANARYYGELDNMTKDVVLKAIGDAYSFWTVKTAKNICKALGIEFNNSLIRKYTGQKDANPDNHPKGLWLKEDKPVRGVAGLSLSYYITEKMGADKGLPQYHGRGRTARTNEEAVRAKLEDRKPYWIK
ncbi:MAG: hypothetical protein KAS32_18825 [Candidatus Peribacteraceae bacterium]|nr:hypothetical protein [Candidatus Peribacteraceae bacterium]